MGRILVRGEHGHDNAGASSASNLAAQVFSALDTNKEGTVSSDELTAAMSSTNGAATNSDNALSQGEVQTFMTTLQQQLEADMNTMGDLMQMASSSYDKAAALNSGVQASTSQSI